MSLFNRRDNESVPTIEVQGEEATIPQPRNRDDSKTNEQSETTIRLPKKIWSR